MPVRPLRALGLLAALLASAILPAAAPAATPPAGMFGLSDWATPSNAALDREGARGLRTWRLVLDYHAIGSTKGSYAFTYFDNLVARAAADGITPVLVLAGCPSWSCTAGGPPKSGQQLTDWRAFVGAAVRRYGTNGTLWTSRPTVPKRPVTHWQVWNEVNGSDQWPSPSAASYSSFLVSTASSIRAADAQAKVVTSGLPEKMTIWMKDYLPALYAQPGFKDAADVIAVHGYTPQASQVAGILDTARRIMVANGDAAAPLWITEMSWATGGPAHPFTTTESGQAANLRASWDTLTACRSRWNLQRTYWFGYQDKVGSPDYWGYHNGLVRTDGGLKPGLAAAEEYFGSAPLPGGRGTTCSLPGGTTLDGGTAPDTSIASGPGARTASTQPVFRFASTRSPVRYECHLEGAPWAACTPAADGTWRPASPLGEGAHRLDVRAIDAQNVADASPASSSFIVDRTPPDTYVAGVWGDVTSKLATLTLSANEPVARYECRIDSGAWATCGSPFTTTLTLGAHTIGVRAVDLAGQVDPNPAEPWYMVR